MEASREKWEYLELLGHILTGELYWHDINLQGIEIVLGLGFPCMMRFWKDNLNRKDHNSLAADI